MIIENPSPKSSKIDNVMILWYNFPVN